MKLKKMTALLLTGAMAVTMLAGCGGKGDSKADEGSKSGSAQGTESAGGTETAAAGSYDTKAIENAGDITITMMVSGTETENDFETDILPKLVKEKWPNVTLEVTKLPDDNYYTALKTRLASGECPDIILVQPMYAGSNSCYALAEAGYLESLDDLKTISLTEDNSGMIYEGHNYGVSPGISILGAYYNKDMFQEAGIESEPKTWDEFLDACQKLQDAGHQPIVMGDKDQYVLQFGLYQLAANEIYSQDPEYDSKLRTEETSFTEEGTWDHVLEMYKELYDKKYIDSSKSLGLSASQAITEFIDGNAAMTFDGSFNVTALIAEGAAGSFERGYFPLPGDKGDVYTATCQGGGYAIYSGSKVKDEAKAIFDVWFDGESEIWDAYVATGKNILTYGNGADTMPNYDMFKPFVDLKNNGKAFHWCNQAWPAGTEGTMQELFSEMVGGQGTTVEDITQGMQDKFEDLLDE